MKWGIHFDLANKRDRVEELDKTMEEPGFWDNPEASAAIVQESRKLKAVIERYEALCTEREDMLTLIEIGEEENDTDLVGEIQSSLKNFEEQFENLRIETLLSGEYERVHAEEKKLAAMQMRSTVWFILYYKLLWGYRNFRKRF